MKPSPKSRKHPAKSPRITPPPFRRLRGYAFDPSLSARLETAPMNEVVFKVPWEGADDLAPGPVGEYVEVIDADPAAGCFYAPVDLNDPLLLAQDGLPPEEGNPQFHQQTVYAVAMTTIRNFERALGRAAFWASDRRAAPEDREAPDFVRRLRIYPHAIREANAYYSPGKKALLFGYFPAAPRDPGIQMPGGVVFACLSHDIVAHETTHALLDGMHRRFLEATHPDALAFHEAFADIVALFQHFTYPEALRHQIAKTRGDLDRQNLLGELARQFGQAIGRYGALRDAIGTIDESTKTWRHAEPDPGAYHRVFEPHDRGAILVGAVFDAFTAIYKSRVADLLRLATGGTGVLREGAIHPDLVNRLAAEAAKSAQHVLGMCIRALDYCPPVDITFGDYLRAIVTADADIVPDDDRGYRIAVIEAFRRRGIHPRDTRSLSIESLRAGAVPAGGKGARDIPVIADRLRGFLREIEDYATTRRGMYARMRTVRARLHDIIRKELGDLAGFERITGLVLRPGRALEGLRTDPGGYPVFEVHSVRPAQRVGPDGNVLNQAVVSITQQREIPVASGKSGSGRTETMTFRGGCTLIFDLDDLDLRYSIRKPVDSTQRLRAQLDLRADERRWALRANYFGALGESAADEPFALVHRGF